MAIPHSAATYVGPERRGRRLSRCWLVLAGALLAAIVFVTLCPIHLRPRLSADPDVERFLAFAALGLAAKLALPRHHAWILAGVIFVAMGTEAAQLVVPGRHARVLDAAVKVLGGVTGVQIGQLGFVIGRALRRAPAGGIESRPSPRDELP